MERGRPVAEGSKACATSETVALSGAEARQGERHAKREKERQTEERRRKGKTNRTRGRQGRAEEKKRNQIRKPAQRLAQCLGKHVKCTLR